MTKMFHPRDLLLLAVPALIIGLITTAIVWNLMSPEGEPIPLAGWVSAGAAVAGVIAVVVAFYVKRWQWVQKYAYTVRGVHYFYEPGAEKYLVVDVDREIEEVVRRWVSYYRGIVEVERITEVESGLYLQGAVCLFRPEESWVHTTPGWLSRRVYGIAIGNYCEVGQGDRSIDRTAHKHELSHVFLNGYEGRLVGEEESHAVFRKVGV